MPRKMYGPHKAKSPGKAGPRGTKREEDIPSVCPADVVVAGDPVGMAGPEMRTRAESLCVIEGMPLPRISTLTGVPVGTLEAWSEESGWQGLRVEYCEALADIRRNTTLLHKRLLDKAIESLDPRMINAVARLEASSARKKTGETRPEPFLPGPEHRAVQSPGEAADALREAVEKKVNLLLNQPEAVSLAAVSELIRAIQLIESLKANHRREPSDSVAHGLSRDAAEAIRRGILGIAGEE